MDPVLAKALRLFRNSYEYPGAHVSVSPALPPPPYGLCLGPGNFGLLHPVAKSPVTDLSLDNYHLGMLRSMAPADTYLGCASVIYWGFITYGAGFSLVRLHRFIGLAPHHLGANPLMTSIAANDANADSRAGNWGGAIGRFGGVPSLGQLPFASKVIAFLDPSNAGVYDNRINNFLAADPLGAILFGPTGAWPSRQGIMVNPRVTRVIAQQFYQRWCLRLQQLRDALNGDKVTWRCTETVRQQWRAVDVERALFWLAAVPANARTGVALPEDDSNIGDDNMHDPASVVIDIDDILRRLGDFFGNQPAV